MTKPTSTSVTSSVTKSALALPFSLKAKPPSEAPPVTSDMPKLKTTEPEASTTLPGEANSELNTAPASESNPVETEQALNQTAEQLNTAPIDEADALMTTLPEGWPAWLDPAQNETIKSITDMLGPDALQWAFPLLAVLGAGFIVLAFFLILLRRILGSRGQKAPQAKPKAQKEKRSAKNKPEKEIDFNDDDFYPTASHARA